MLEVQPNRHVMLKNVFSLYWGAVLEVQVNRHVMLKKRVLLYWGRGIKVLKYMYKLTGIFLCYQNRCSLVFSLSAAHQLHD